MVSVPAGIQTQLGEAVSVIADSDFWERWDNLVDVSLILRETCWTIVDGYFFAGPCFQTSAEQPFRQHWCAPGCALDFQEMETPVPVERAVY